MQIKLGDSTAVRCQTMGCGAQATCRVTGVVKDVGPTWDGRHCSVCAVKVVGHQMFQVDIGDTVIVVAPLGVKTVLFG